MYCMFVVWYCMYGTNCVCMFIGLCMCMCCSSLSPYTMTQCRELETTHHERVSVIANQLLERFSRNQLGEEECPDQLRMVSNLYIGSLVL